MKRRLVSTLLILTVLLTACSSSKVSTVDEVSSSGSGKAKYTKDKKEETNEELETLEESKGNTEENTNPDNITNDVLGSWNESLMSKEARSMVQELEAEDLLATLYLGAKPITLYGDLQPSDETLCKLFDIYAMASSIGFVNLDWENPDSGRGTLVVNDNKDAPLHWSTQKEFWDLFGMSTELVNELEYWYGSFEIPGHELRWRVSDKKYWIDDAVGWPEDIGVNGAQYIGLNINEADTVFDNYIQLDGSGDIYVFIMPNSVDVTLTDDYTIRLVLKVLDDKELSYENRVEEYIDVLFDFYTLAEECGDSPVLYVKDSKHAKWNDTPGVIVNIDKASTNDRLSVCEYIRKNSDFDWNDYLTNKGIDFVSVHALTDEDIDAYIDKLIKLDEITYKYLTESYELALDELYKNLEE